MYKIDLNSDLGESFGRYSIGENEAIIPLLTSANVACGYHASDPVVMTKTLELTKDAGIRAGAHPGLPDLMGFGRREMKISPAEAKAYTQYQVAALYGMAKAQGLKLQHVKPHGALYNMAAKDYDLAIAICEAVKELDDSLIMLTLADSELEKASKDLGLRTAAEFFADRAYEEDGTLRNRRLNGAMVTDEEEALARTVRMIKEGLVRTHSGKDIPVTAHSVCVHSDSAKAEAFIRTLRERLGSEDIRICPLDEIV